MSRKTVKYEDVRQQMQPGDVIAFSGKGNFSEIIKWATRSEVSHVGIVFASKVFHDDRAQQGIIVDVMESTTLNYERPDGKVIAGVQRNRMSDHIQYYDGSIWWLPLSNDVRNKLDLKALTNFLLNHDNKEYDLPQAVKSAFDALDQVPLLSKATYNVEDFSKFFCSELVTAALEAGGAMQTINAAEVTPVDLCMFSIYSGEYYQLKGEKAHINGYNTRSPEGFGLRK